jgi:hypothetical protein
MVEATNKNNTIVLLLPKGMKADEQGWAAKFSTAENPVKVITSSKNAKFITGMIIYALASDAEGTADCASVFKT